MFLMKNAAAHSKANELAFRIPLRLNPKEAEHNELVLLLNELGRASPDPTPGETRDDIARELAVFRTAREKVIRQL